MNYSDEAFKAIRTLTEQGYAVVVITPEELKNAPAGKVEDRLIELSWDIIDCLQD